MDLKKYTPAEKAKKSTSPSNVLLPFYTVEVLQLYFSTISYFSILLIICHTLNWDLYSILFLHILNINWKESPLHVAFSWVCPVKNKAFPQLSAHVKGFKTFPILPAQTERDFGSKWQHYSKYIKSPKLNTTVYDWKLWFLPRLSHKSSISLHAYYIYECFHFAAWHCNK